MGDKEEDRVQRCEVNEIRERSEIRLIRVRQNVRSVRYNELPQITNGVGYIIFIRQSK